MIVYVILYRGPSDEENGKVTTQSKVTTHSKVTTQ